MVKKIHINQHVIKHNRKHGVDLPPCTIKEGSKNRYAREVVVNGPSKLVYSPDNPLSCGAVLWIETDSPVELLGEVTYAEVRQAMKDSREGEAICKSMDI